MRLLATLLSAVLVIGCALDDEPIRPDVVGTSDSTSPTTLAIEGDNCHVLDFDTDAGGNAIVGGDVLGEQYAAYGVHIASWRDSTGAQPSNSVAFDGTNPTGGDDDLYFPDLGNILISHERPYDPNATRVDDPDDDAGGAYFELSFDTDTCVNGMTALDIDNDENPVDIEYLDNNGVVIDTSHIGITGGNGRGAVARQVCGVRTLAITLSSSGAIDDIEVCDHNGGLSGLGLGEAVLLDFGPDTTIVSVFSRIREEFLQPGTIETSFIDMTISSVDGINHFHGTDVIQLADTTPVSQSGELVTVQIDWTEDFTPQVVGDLYTVCATLHTGSEIGPERCQDFGPFF